MYAKYFTVYFRRTIKFDARVANLILYYSNVNVLRNDNNVARVKSKRIETSICSIINIKLSTPIFGLPMIRCTITMIKVLCWPVVLSVYVARFRTLCKFRNN